MAVATPAVGRRSSARRSTNISEAGMLVGIAALVLVAAQTATPSPQSAEATATIKEELEAVCRQVLCRPVQPIRLRLEGGTPFVTTLMHSVPIVSGETITVFPGETVMVEGLLKDGRLTDLKAVPSNVHPERTLVFTFKQEPSLNDGTGMLLAVDSPFPGVLKYTLGMMFPSSDAIRRTSVCPLRQGLTSYESWPHPIFQLLATDFVQVDPTSEAASRCE